MNLHELSPAVGSRKETKRIGRGHGSGQGKTAGKGQKVQMPLQRRIPKRGFNNIFAKKIVAINVGSLNVFENGTTVDAAAIIKAGITKKEYDGIKIIGNGKLEKNLIVKAAAFSESAKTKIEAAGGKAEVI